MKIIQHLLLLEDFDLNDFCLKLKKHLVPAISVTIEHSSETLDDFIHKSVKLAQRYPKAKFHLYSRSLEDGIYTKYILIDISNSRDLPDVFDKILGLGWNKHFVSGRDQKKWNSLGLNKNTVSRPSEDEIKIKTMLISEAKF